MADRQERYANLLGRAAMDVWGDMPRDIQEALFETAMKGQDAEREELARLLHDRHPRTLHPPRRDPEGGKPTSLRQVMELPRSHGCGPGG
jgi:hypothetical protein